MRSLFSFRGELPRSRWLQQFFWDMAAGVALQIIMETLPTDDALFAHLGRAASLYLVLFISLVPASIAAAWIMIASTAKRARYFGARPGAASLYSCRFFGWMLALIYYGQADEIAPRLQV
jgi:hypothetical protein